ncbi:hypothetical protein F4678DRAFT_293987 [Xylaria arbuscula]|nr:hypothetical protein F4678DRAFT_293987 [Xylaria arbuscula]
MSYCRARSAFPTLRPSLVLRAFDKQPRFKFLIGLFRRTESGGIAHTGLSAAMPASNPYIKLRLGRLFCWGAHEVASALQVGYACTEDISCALADQEGCGRPCFQQLEGVPDGKGTECYSAVRISLFNNHSGNFYLPFVHGFGWGPRNLGDTVVDVGGGNGHIEGEIAPLILEPATLI